MKELGPMAFSIWFEKAKNARFVLSNRPWTVNGCHVNCRNWPHSGIWSKHSFDFSIFWVRVVGLTLPYLSVSDVEKVNSKIVVFRGMENKKQRDIIR